MFCQQSHRTAASHLFLQWKHILQAWRRRVVVRILAVCFGADLRCFFQRSPSRQRAGQRGPETVSDTDERATLPDMRGKMLV